MQLITQAEKRYNITSRPMATGESLQQNVLSFRLKVILWISSTVPRQQIFLAGRNHSENISPVDPSAKLHSLRTL